MMRYLMIIGILVSLFLAPVCGPEVYAQEALFSLTEDIDYDITIQLAQGIISKIKNIRVIGTVEIANKTFLVGEFKSDPKTTKSLIALDSIKTIVPTRTSHETLISDLSLK